MNAIGIDVEAIQPVIALREGNDLACMPAIVMSDGTSHEAGSPPHEFRWFEVVEAVRAFMGLHATQEVPECAVVVENAASPGMDKELREAGFKKIERVTSSDAALVHAVCSGSVTVNENRAFIVVAAGHRHIEVAAYRLRTLAGGSPVISRVGSPLQIGETGAAFWVEEIMKRVRVLIPEIELTNHDDALRRSAREFGMRLSRVANRLQPIPWLGPRRGAMITSLELSGRICEEWPSVRRLREELPAAVLQQKDALGSEQAVLLIAGAAAEWPFVRNILHGHYSLVLAEEPQFAFARGAALWPLFGERLFAIRGETPAPTRTAADATHEKSFAGKADLNRIANLLDRMNLAPGADHE